MTKIKLLAALLLALCLLGCGKAEEAPAPVESPKAELILPPRPSALVKAPYEEAKVYFGSMLRGRAYIKDGEVYIAPETVAEYFSLELSTICDESGFKVSARGLEIEGRWYDEYLVANCRYLYTPDLCISHGGRVYLPVDIIERVFGVNVTVYGEPLQVEISADGLSLIEGGEGYYDIHHGEEDIYWLQQIIYSEARDEPLAGMIGVGNVVFNRVESELFPDTVFDVIYDREHAVQFDPIVTGGIHAEADKRSYIAARLCLEGYNTVGDCLFFVNPVKGDATWVSENRSFVCTIGRHDFYA